MSSSPRLASVDALRGMLIGAMITLNNPGDWAFAFGQLGHSAWHGCTLMDLGMPSFLFLVGVSMALFVRKGAEESTDVRELRRTLIWRGIRLVLLGWLLAAIAVTVMPSLGGAPIPWRPMGVLPRIGICLALASLVYFRTSPAQRWIAYLGWLAAYFAALAWWGDLSRDHSLPSRVDALLLGHFALSYDPATGMGHDPEGILSTLAATTSVVLGSICGDWLLRGKIREMAVTGAFMMAAGYAMHRLAMPMNKALWTPPFALFAGGLALVVMPAGHVLFDRRGWPPIGRRFGTHAIAAFVASLLLIFLLQGLNWHRPAYSQSFAWLATYIGAKPTSHLFGLAQAMLIWVLIRWMDARKLRVRI